MGIVFDMEHNAMENLACMPSWKELKVVRESLGAPSTQDKIWVKDHPSEYMYRFDWGMDRICVYANGYYSYLKGNRLVIRKWDCFVVAYYKLIDPNNKKDGERKVFLLSKECDDLPCVFALLCLGEDAMGENNRKRYQSLCSDSIVVDGNDWHPALSVPDYATKLEQDERNYELQYYRKNLLTNIPAAMEQLTERQKLILNRIWFDGLSEKKIAAELGISQQGVSRIYRQSLKKMKKILGNMVV